MTVRYTRRREKTGFESFPKNVLPACIRKGNPNRHAMEKKNAGLECIGSFAPEWTYLRAIANARNLEALRSEETAVRKFLDDTFLS